MSTGIVSVSALWIASVTAKGSDSLIHSSFQDKKREIHITHTSGDKPIMFSGHTLADGYPVVSPNGKKVAFYGKYDGYKTWSIHVADIDGQNIQRLTFDKQVWDAAPSWSPDSSKIAFVSDNVVGLYDIYIMNADGSDITRVAENGSQPSWFSPRP